MNRILNFAILLVILLTTGCSKESLSSGGDFDQDGAAILSMSFATSQSTNDPRGERVLNTVRIIAFSSNSNGGDLNSPVLNKIYTGTGSDRISIRENVPAGYLNIYLIGNELASDNARFSAINHINDLTPLMWNYNANRTYLTPAFPMFSAYKGIRIDTNGVIDGMTPNPSTGNEYTFQIERAVAKVEVKINCDFATHLGGTKIQLDKAVIKQLPHQSYLFAGEYGSLPEDKYFNLSEVVLAEGTHLTSSESGFEIGEDKLVFYVPEHLTSPSKTYTYLELTGSLKQTPSIKLTYKVPLGDGLTFHTPKQMVDDFASLTKESYYLRRNTHYTLSLTLKSLGSVDGIFVNQMVRRWVVMHVDGSLTAPYLNVSTVNTTVSNLTSQRVYFWTNQRNVRLETVGKLGTTSGSDFTVNDVFDHLAGGGASNFSFTFDNATGTGKGHFDLTSSRVAANQKYLLYLNANNLRREIAVNGLQLVDLRFVDPSASNYAGYLDAHYDSRPIKINAPATKIDILKSDGSPIGAGDDWLRFSHKSTYPLAGERTGHANQLRTSEVIANASDTWRYLYADENVTGADRGLILRFTFANSQTELSTNPMAIKDYHITQRTPDIAGLFGGVQDTHGYTQPLGVEHNEEYDMAFKTGDVTRVGVFWGFNNITIYEIDKVHGMEATSAMARLSTHGITGTLDPLYNTYAARYCYEKNRDLDGNGQLDPNEIKWYLPAQNQLMGIYAVRNGLTTTFHPTYLYWSATRFNNTTSFASLLTSGRLTTRSKNTYSSVRCVRDM